MRRSLILGLFAVALLGAAPSGVTLAPVYGASQGWLNGRLTPAETAGKVVIVDVFTFDCYNCKNVVPNLRALNAKKSDDLVIVGVHSPETPFETNHANVVANLKTQGITWPVAIDNSFAIWHAYNVDAWPTQLFFDRTGKLRATIVGDSQDDAVDRIVQKLLAEPVMLRDNALFSGVEGASLARVLSVFRVGTIPADSPLYVSGGIARRVFLIVTGSVAVTQRTGDLDTVVTILGPGEFTGERALLHPSTRHLWSAVCCEESRIAYADADVLLAALTAFPALGVNVAAALHRRVHDASLAIDGLIAGA